MRNKLDNVRAALKTLASSQLNFFDKFCKSFLILYDALKEVYFMVVILVSVTYLCKAALCDFA